MMATRAEFLYAWFLERRTDSIRRRGENVSDWEVERLLAEHPGLLEAAVFGVPAFRRCALTGLTGRRLIG
jgi:acyl-CoA synthetase (AMP-forming)/AMP-acid ligase II